MSHCTEDAWEEYLRKEGEREATYEEATPACKPCPRHWAEDGGYFGNEGCHTSLRVEEEYDAVEYPKHYQILDGAEAKDIIAELTKGLKGFDAVCYGAILKYVLRANKKGEFSQDLMKAKQYIEMMNLP